MKIIKNIQYRLFSKIDTTGDCWEWKGYKSKKGYGKFGIGRRVFFAHRIMWSLLKGSIPPKINVCHHCDNPSCVNPDHLFLGSQKVNLQDAAKKGRTSRGQNRPMSKITDKVASQIRSEHLSGVRQIDLCSKYELVPSTIHNLVKRKTYKHIP